ncbi:MAG TPA: ABC transporter permease [Actinomycetes bacterium]|nr:ABC transporter permease [Actinomycetes bacterium]
MSDTVDVAARVEPAPAGRPSRGLPRRIGEAFLRRREASVLVVAVGLGIYFASASPAFLTKPNMVNISQATAPAAIIAAGMVLVLVCGEIDLSVAAVFALAPFNMHYLTDYYGVPILAAIVLALAISALIGFVNGFITVFFRVPSFVTTLGTAYIVIGLVLVTSHAYPAPIPDAATETIRHWFGASDWAHLAWCLLIVAAFHLLLTRTRWGLHTIAVGGNPLGATEAGIRAGRIKIGNFMMVATLGGFAGILDAFRINTIDPNLGGGFGIMFTAVSAAVIGGTSLAGGSGTVIGAALGALVLAELQNGMNLIGISANPYFLILGAAIVVSMIANVYLSRLRRAGRT